MNGRPSETYHCNSKGCSNGYGSAFAAAPASWFAERGMTPPKNCPDCRKWIKAQGDEAVRCVSCNRTMRLSARLKISHHKRTGPWALPEECRQCERGERPPISVSRPRPRERSLSPMAERFQAFSDLKPGIPVGSRIISVELADYQHKIGLDHRETRKEHLERHIPGSPNSLVGEGKSATALVDTKARDASSLLSALSVLMYSADPSRTREYIEGTRIVRLTLLDDGRVERTVIEKAPGPRGHGVVTSHDDINIATMLRRYGGKQPPHSVQ